MLNLIIIICKLSAGFSVKLKETFLGNNVVISYRLETEKEIRSSHFMTIFTQRCNNFKGKRRYLFISEAL